MPLVKRLGKATLKSLVELDAFPKVAEDLKVKTTTGGTYSVLALTLIFILTTHEIYYYSSSKIIFGYTVDKDIDAKLDLNIDITIASPCETIGADIIDPTNQNNGYAYGELKEEPVSFQLSSTDQEAWNNFGALNGLKRSEHHVLLDFFWSKMRTKSLMGLDLGDVNERKTVHSTPGSDGCRIHGVLTANKVAGNFHVKTGKHVPLPIGHVHISLFQPFGNSGTNFSHRIERFFFGKDIPSIVNPLEGEEKIDSSGRMLYQYFIKVVPTDVVTKELTVSSYQYSVTEADREIDHHSGSHGTPGIYFKYDIDAISVQVGELEYPVSQLIIRILGMIAGIYTISGFLTNLSNAFMDIVTCRYMERVRTGGSLIPGSGFHSISSL